MTETSRNARLGIILDWISRFSGVWPGFPSGDEALKFYAGRILAFAQEIPEQTIETASGVKVLPAVSFEDAVEWLFTAAADSFERFPKPIEFRVLWCSVAGWDPADGRSPEDVRAANAAAKSY